ATVASDLEDDRDQTEPLVPPLPYFRGPASASQFSSRRNGQLAVNAAPASSHSGSRFNDQTFEPGHRFAPPGPTGLSQAHQYQARNGSDMYAPSSHMPRNYYEGGHAFIEELSSQHDSESLQPDEESQEAEQEAKKEGFAKKLKSVFGKK
ncbi:hypothetical protein C0992_008138, partial [Termitomyces sp. T32_za158]